MKPQRFKHFIVTDVAGLAKAYPGVVRNEPRADPFKVQKLLDCGVDLSAWVQENDTPDPAQSEEAEITVIIPDNVKVVSAAKYDGNGNAVEIPVDDVVIPKFMNKKGA